MTRRLLSVLIILLTGCAHLPHTPFDARETVPAAALVSDFDLMRSALEQAHPGLYDFTVKTEMDALFVSIRAELTHGMTESDFLRRIAPLNGAIGCGHTAILPSVAMRTYLMENAGLFPCDVRIAGGDMFVFRCYVPRHEDLKGKKIVSINGTPADDLIEQFNEVLPTDGRNVTHQYKLLDGRMRYYYAAFIGMPGAFAITLADDHRDSSLSMTVTLPAMAESALRTHTDYVSPDSDDRDLLTFDIQEDASTAVMTIRSFGGSEDYMPFLENSFKELRDKTIDNLIVDLRDNGGGEDEYGAALAAYLLDQPFRYYRSLDVKTDHIDFQRYTDLTRSDIHEMQSMIVKSDDGWYHVGLEHHPCLSQITPREPGFRGKVLVLIDGGSFSATSEVAAILQEHHRAEFIGEETGGRCSGNNSGYMTILTLPETGIRVVLPFVRYVLEVDGCDHPDRGVFPDYFVEPSIDDVINGIDRVMMEAEGMLKIEN
ncbi:hypothetical protein JW823_07220 [bacterium]|nr:hypothetical protein [candidate division CSSED10-310 bacterium]